MQASTHSHIRSSHNAHVTCNIVWARFHCFPSARAWNNVSFESISTYWWLKIRRIMVFEVGSIYAKNQFLCANCPKSSKWTSHHCSSFSIGNRSVVSFTRNFSNIFRKISIIRSILYVRVCVLARMWARLVSHFIIKYITCKSTHSY